MTTLAALAALLLVITALTVTLLLLVITTLAALAALLLVIATLAALLLVIAALSALATTLLLLVVTALPATLLLVVTALAGLAAADEAGLLLGVVLALLVTVEAGLLLGVQVLLVPAVLQLLRVHPDLVQQPGVLLRVNLIHPLQLLRCLLVVPAELTDQVQDLTGIKPHEHSFSRGPTQACASRGQVCSTPAPAHTTKPKKPDRAPHRTAPHRSYGTAGPGYFPPASPNAVNAAAAWKYLFFPKSCTVLMLNACASNSASPLLTPAKALTGAAKS